MVIAGAVFGPAAYFTGESLGAIEFHLSSLLSGLVIGIVWAISMPGIFFINRCQDRLTRIFNYWNFMFL